MGQSLTGKPIKPTVIVIDGEGFRLDEGREFSVTYTGNTSTGIATASVSVDSQLYKATKKLTFTIKKAENGLVVKVKNMKAKKNKKTTFKVKKIFTVTGAFGKVIYKKTKGNKKISINSAGKVTVKRGLKKGKKYKVTVQITAAGDANHDAKTVTKAFKVAIK